ncbi:RsmD family RNA methyltransferase [Candidatus Saccharibacteria bacterium]|nr:RsmD family RNA methyltransferase [Candidatus Saccharibacteria bacterium]
MKTLNSKVTGGFLRGREILSPASSETHPMGSRERLAILNSIGPDINGAVVLDLFAGTGALGIESLSRGAKTVTFVEKHHKTTEILRKNLQLLSIEKNALVLEKDVKLAQLTNDFDYVFIDPPYDKIKDFDIVDILQKFSMARKIILSHPKDVEYGLEGFEKRTKTYAAAAITIFTSNRK